MKSSQSSADLSEASMTHSLENFLTRKSSISLKGSIPQQLSQSLRFDAAIEKQLGLIAAAGQETIVMSRRDALRAVQDELLERSPEHAWLARCGLAARLQHRHIVSGVHDWVDYASHHYKQHPEVVQHVTGSVTTVMTIKSAVSKTTNSDGGASGSQQRARW
jgi:hypothetical protein